ncbi:uncharacterized protein TNCV_4571251 [Trichonephila clavipes]|nr:uncharacterized protein TNCV_4571251 [Trichonephila clavipes]
MFRNRLKPGVSVRSTDRSRSRSTGGPPRHLEGLKSDTAFNEMLCDTREFADEIDIPANFELIQPRHKVRRRNVNFDYEAREDPIEDPTLKYKAEFYFFILEREREIKLSMHLNLARESLGHQSIPPTNLGRVDEEMVPSGLPEPERSVRDLFLVHWSENLFTAKSERPRWRATRLADHLVSLIFMILPFSNSDNCSYCLGGGRRHRATKPAQNRYLAVHRDKGGQRLLSVLVTLLQCVEEFPGKHSTDVLQ